MFGKRTIQCAVIFGCIVFLTLSLYPFRQARKAGNSVVDHYKDAFSKIPSFKAKGPKEARRLYASELMQRPLATDLTQLPKIFHQSWMNSTLPAKFEEWSHSCRKQHPDWEWVLWTDEDNLKLIERFAPWFMNAYEDLGGEIFRADVVRNVYMHVFGGVYADLDTECLRPYDNMFARYNTSTVSHVEATIVRQPGENSDTGHKYPTTKNKTAEETSLPAKKPGYAKDKRTLFLGRMGTDPDFDQSLPNAWMASTPGHPFWLLPLEACADHISSGWSPEALTGPAALFNAALAYQGEYQEGKGRKLDEHYAKSGWRHLYKQLSEKAPAPPPQSIEILPFYEIYPYSWHRDGQMYRDECWVSQPTFDAKRCKLLLGLDAWRSHSITYWSHSWTAEGHSDENMDALIKPNKNNPAKEKMKGDAAAENKKLEDEKEKQEHAKEHELDKRWQSWKT